MLLASLFSSFFAFTRNSPILVKLLFSKSSSVSIALFESKDILITRSSKIKFIEENEEGTSKETTGIIAEEIEEAVEKEED